MNSALQCFVAIYNTIEMDDDSSQYKSEEKELFKKTKNILDKINKGEKPTAEAMKSLVKLLNVLDSHEGYIIGQQLCVLNLVRKYLGFLNLPYQESVLQNSWVSKSSLMGDVVEYFFASEKNTPHCPLNSKLVNCQDTRNKFLNASFSKYQTIYEEIKKKE